MSTPVRPFLSLCMIVKNESQHLAKCLASARAVVDEIVVVDTGSADNTVEIAQSFGAKLAFFEWTDDFAAARNYSLKQVTGEWILHLDADEELVVEDPTFRQQLAARPEILAFAVDRIDINVPQELVGGFHLRVFQNLPEFRYANRFHEQLQYNGDRERRFEFLPGIKILHYGNSTEAAVIHKALTRDIPILANIRQQETLSFWLLDVLARKYMRTEQFDQAQDCYTEALDRLLPHLISGEKPEDYYWVPTLLHLLGGNALDQQDFETARMICQRGLEWFPHHVPLIFLTGQMLLELGFPLGAIAYFEQCLQLAQTNRFYSLEPCQRSLLNVDPICAIGVAYQAMQDWPQAIAAFEQALALDPHCAIAQTHLEEVQLQQHSS